ncbi:hypothetical protein Salat_2660700 [Sesamum alatum]|uniref:Uncharacterized protein n=1 Tax=Sesamum alatum TaxID=300844 RepID=A0AAE2CAZ2_9LAMI|nr:hypothetical protein Salat_2660700 [Sesamum alatum]
MLARGRRLLRGGIYGEVVCHQSGGVDQTCDVTVLLCEASIGIVASSGPCAGQCGGLCSSAGVVGVSHAGERVGLLLSCHLLEFVERQTLMDGRGMTPLGVVYQAQSFYEEDKEFLEPLAGEHHQQHEG